MIEKTEKMSREAVRRSWVREGGREGGRRGGGGGGGGGERETLKLTYYITEQANSPFQWGNKRLPEPRIYVQ